MNIVILLGRLSRPAEVRLLPSGDQLVAFDVSVRPPTGKTETVPVVWLEPPAAARHLDVDEEVVVVGRVRRRFFRAGGTTQSRTEVLAEAVVPSRQAKRAQRALAQARAVLDGQGRVSA